MPRFDQKTLKKVPSVNVNDTKPMVVETIDKGENNVCDMVTPMMDNKVVTGEIVLLHEQRANRRIEPMIVRNALCEYQVQAMFGDRTFVFLVHHHSLEA